MSVAANLLPANTAGVETDTSGWTAGANTTLSRSSRFYTGAYSLGMTASAAGTVTATTSARVAVTPGTQYTAYAYFANVATASGRTATVRVDWYAAVTGGSALSSVTAPAIPLPAATTWVTPPPILLANAPTAANYASVSVTVTGLTLGSVVAADLISFGLPATVTGNLIGYAASSAEIDATGWDTYANVVVSRASSVAWEGWYSLLLTSVAAGEVESRLVAQLPVTAGTEYAGSAMVQTSTASDFLVELWWYDATATFMTAASVRWSLPSGGWTRVTTAGVAPAGAVTARLILRPQATAAGQAWQCDRMAVIATPKAAGELLSYNVRSMEIDGSGWTAVSGCTVDRSTDYAYEGGASLKVTPTAGLAANAMVETVAHVPITARQAYQVTPRVRLGPSTELRYATLRFSWYDSADVLLSYVDLRWTLTASGGGWYSPQSSTVAPSGATGLAIGLLITSPETTETIYVDDVSLVPGGLAVVVDPIPERYGASISMQGLTAGGYAYWGLWRMDESGSMTAVRGPAGDLSQVTITGDTAVAEDYEAPLGVPISYYLRVWTTPTNYRATVTELSGIPEPEPTDIVLKDPGVPARQTTAVVAAGGQPQWTRKARQGINAIRGRTRPVIISDVRTSREGTMTLVTETGQDLADMWWLLETGNTLLIQWPSLFGEPDAYVQIGDVTEAPIVDFAEYRDRTWSIPLIEVDRPIGGSVGSAGRTWQTVADTNADWLAVMSAATSWLDVYTGVNGG
ncbi:hypothetical protein [Streptomyces sp. ITFR-6]|uniref:hypothetical protein n=1 Tax=Streptomyces sp. ITFR-6 TaxID=3075197 RepID=UPI0028897A9F|nr:hypothetical protein [Streptomyces sp. ITFR-6]WNI28659.1 hypothetical protein RLT59_07535 [Streptomyces sp. ITFR-6]